MASTEFRTYVSTKGHQKPALVIVDESTFNDGTSLEAPFPGHAHLLVFGLGGASKRLNVPTKETAEAAAAEQGDLLDQPELRGYFS